RVAAEPRAPTRPARRTSSAASAVGRTMRAEMRILVVDDEPAFRQAVSRALSLERYDVEQASDGREALERLAGDGLDAVVLDVAITEALRFADVLLDPATYDVRRGERAMELTRTEFLLLELFLRNPRQVLSRLIIFERVWGYDFGTRSNSLGVYVGYLRRKLEEGGEPRLLHTIRGVGYVLRDS